MAPCRNCRAKPDLDKSTARDVMSRYITWLPISINGDKLTSGPRQTSIRGNVNAILSSSSEKQTRCQRKGVRVIAIVNAHGRPSRSGRTTL